jgi:hypothetical protein
MLAFVYWILATIFLVIALAVPRWRPIGVVGCVILGVMLAWGMVQRLRGNDSTQTQSTQQRGRPATPAAALQSVSLDLVVAEDLQLSGGGAPYDLKGRITNRSRDVLLKSVTIRMTRRDCYEGALDPTGCALLWQDQHWTAVAIPPGQAREFATSIWMRGAAPRPRGTSRDTFEVIAATGEIVPSNSATKAPAAVENQDE